MAAACAVALLSTVAGCGTDPGGVDNPPNTPHTVSSLPGQDQGPGTTTPSASQPPTKPSVPPDTGTTTLRGRLAEPVEAGCVVLSTDDGSYVLLGVPKKISRLDPGTALVVHGSVAKSAMTTCQQGTPFRVETATPA